MFIPILLGNHSHSIHLRQAIIFLARGIVSAQEVSMHHKACKRSCMSYTASAAERSGARKTSDWREEVGLPTAAPSGASGAGAPEFNPQPYTAQ